MLFITEKPFVIFTPESKEKDLQSKRKAPHKCEAISNI